VPFHAAMREMPGWDRDPFRNIAAIVVRLAPGETPAAASAQASSAIERKDRRVTLSPIGGGDVTATEQRIAYWLTGVSVLVLVIGLANSATLLLIRGAARRRDFAIRSALGATRGRLLAQAIVEATLLAATAVGVALLLAYWFDEAVRSVLLPTVVHSAGLTLRTLAAAALAGVLVLVVAAAAAVAQLPRSLRDADLAGSSTRPRRIARSGQALLLVQTTLSVVLLAGTGLFGRSLYNLMSQEFGMRTGDVLLVEFDRGPGAARELEQLYSSALERIRALPGVEIATTVKTMPFTGFHVPPISVPGLAGPPRVNGQLPFLIAATPQFLEILDVAIVEGRRFVESDERGAPVVIVNETMARSVWPGESALGKCIRIGFEPSFDPSTATGPPPPPATVPCREVIGVARNVRQRSVVPSGSEDRLMQYFVPFSQVPPPPAGVGPGPGIQGLLLRTTAGPGVLAAPIRRVVLDGRTDLPFLQVRRYSELLERQMRPWRLGTALLSLFGALALGVAAVGLYATFAHSV
jgi:putative ABC transport system permease protein